MAKLWADNIVAGNRSFSEVPRLLKSQVRKLLDEAGFEITEEESNG